jgi:hypothetical protein
MAQGVIIMSSLSSWTGVELWEGILTMRTVEKHQQ